MLTINRSVHHSWLQYLHVRVHQPRLWQALQYIEHVPVQGSRPRRGYWAGICNRQFPDRESLGSRLPHANLPWKEAALAPLVHRRDERHCFLPRRNSHPGAVQPRSEAVGSHCTRLLLGPQRDCKLRHLYWGYGLLCWRSRSRWLTREQLWDVRPISHWQEFLGSTSLS